MLGLTLIISEETARLFYEVILQIWHSHQLRTRIPVG